MNYLADSTETRSAQRVSFNEVPALHSDMADDVLLRFKLEEGTLPAFVGAMLTEDALSVARSLHNEKAVLAEALVGSGRYMEYVGHHVSFLLGQMTDDEFGEISQSFCVAPGVDIEELASRIEIILRETGKVFPPEQLEEFCSVTGEEVEEALGLLAARGLVMIEE